MLGYDARRGDYLPDSTSTKRLTCITTTFGPMIQPLEDTLPLIRLGLQAEQILTVTTWVAVKSTSVVHRTTNETPTLRFFRMGVSLVLISLLMGMGCLIINGQKQQKKIMDVKSRYLGEISWE